MCSLFDDGLPSEDDVRSTGKYTEGFETRSEDQIGSLLNACYEAGGDMDGTLLFLLDEVYLGDLGILATARDASGKFSYTSKCKAQKNPTCISDVANSAPPTADTGISNSAVIRPVSSAAV
jgi:hypothetical protein